MEVNHYLILYNDLTTVNADLFDWIYANNYLIESDGTYHDVLLISTTNPYDEKNKPHRVYQKSTGSKIDNMPSSFPAGSGFVGFRLVHYWNKDNITVRLIQISGREFRNTYGSSSGWAGWVEIPMSVNNTLTSTATNVALTAAQGKVLNDTKLNKAGDTMTDSLTITKAADPYINFRIGSDTSDQIGMHMYGGSKGSRYFGLYDKANTRHFFIYEAGNNRIFLSTVMQMGDGWFDLKHNDTVNMSYYCYDTDDVYIKVNDDINKYLVLLAKRGLHLATNNDISCGNTAWNAGVPIYAASYNQWSTRLVKENINSMSDDDGLKVLDLNPVHFDFKESFGGKKNQCGLIAEETLEVLPEVVNIPEGYDGKYDPEKGLDNKLLSIDYSKIVPHLIKLCQVQQDKINELEARIEVLENK